MGRWIFFVGLACSFTQGAEAFRKFILSPTDVTVIQHRTCVSFLVSLVNADGEPATVERDKEIIFTSTAPSTEFYAYFDPPCVSQLRGNKWTLAPGQTQFRFSIREELSRKIGREKDLPHGITITVSARGIQAVKHQMFVHTTDCGVACRESSVRNRVACTRGCGGGEKREKVPLDNQLVRRCWHECYVEQEKNMTLCEKMDDRYASGSCASSCSTFCEQRMNCCIGKCYFLEDTRNTRLGVKCVENCYLGLDKCYQTQCKG